MRVLKVQKTDVLPAFVMGTLLLQVIIFVVLMLEGAWLARLSSKPAPSLVQMVDGQAIQVASTGHLERTPDVIRRFVSDTMTLMFNWSGTLPPETIEEARLPKPDPGVSIQGEQGEKRVATATWQASFALSESFRREFVQKVAAMMPADVFNNSGTQVLLVVRRVGDPVQVEEGKWKVDLVSNLIIFNQGDRLGKAIAFNKEIFLMAIDPPTQPLGDNASPLEQVIYRVRQAGMEIYAIRDLQQENLK
jgi:hypothetical protein